MDPQTTFKNNISRHQSAYERLDRRIFLVSWLRVFVFVIAAALSTYLFYNVQLAGGFITVAAGFILFGMVVNIHRKMKFDQRQEEVLIAINHEEISRLEGDLGSFEGGERFADSEHDYTADLDVFGRNSLYQLLNRSYTPSGQAKIAEWLREPSTSSTIRLRQQAVRELIAGPEWCQKIQSLSRHRIVPDHDIVYDQFNKWISDETDQSKTSLAIAIIAGLFNLSLTILVVAGVINVTYIFLPIVLGLVLIRPLHNYMKESAGITFKAVRFLQTYIYLIKAILSHYLESDYLAERKQKLIDPYPAIKEIKKFILLMDVLNNRENLIYPIFNGIFLIDIFLNEKIHRWKQKNRSNLTGWIEAISEIEAINSLSAFSFANPDYAFPQISEDGQIFEATGMGHPLIPFRQRVNNDFSLTENNRIGIITGSNMSGKSTFLRTVGVNLLLAQIGSPVCARHFRFTAVGIFSSMRTTDNLEENISSFYAELRRIERLIKLVNEGRNVFFLMDEVLKGTNTHDRHLGARSLIKQLVKSNCRGLVSTHDIALGQLANSDTILVNHHFGSDINDGVLSFDYLIKPGVCKSFNASQLMSQIGIELDKESDEM